MGYLEHFTATDLKTLAKVAEHRAGDRPRPASLGADPGRVEELLAHPDLFDRLFGTAGSDEVFVAASPFLVFAVLVHRAAAELERSSFVVERAGERARLPV
ncbi:MAG TPA: hypothetical protein VKY26_04885, partial [Actinomycetota bacterium]|nr:hypothetical protein [Actinomycetota bacterium]